MDVEITSVREIGLIIRATRKAQGVRLDDLAGSVGVGHVFVREVEHGKVTVQIGRTLRLLAELGISLSLQIPDDVLPSLERLRARGLRTLAPRPADRRVTANAKRGGETPRVRRRKSTA